VVAYLCSALRQWPSQLQCNSLLNQVLVCNGLGCDERLLLTVLSEGTCIVAAYPGHQRVSAGFLILHSRHIVWPRGPSV